MSTGVPGCLLGSLLVASTFLGRKKVSRVKREQRGSVGAGGGVMVTVCGQPGFLELITSGKDSPEAPGLRRPVCLEHSPAWDGYCGGGGGRGITGARSDRVW